MDPNSINQWLCSLLTSNGIGTLPQSPFVAVKYTPETKTMEAIFRTIIVGPEAYIPIVHFLNTATEEHTLVVYIDNDGGSLCTGMLLAQAFKTTKAKVITKAITIAASSAALIFTNGHEMECLPGGHLMYHTASYINIGKTNDHLNQAKYIHILVDRIMQETKEVGLINQEEHDLINRRGSDIFIPGKLARERLKTGRSVRQLYPIGGAE